MPTKIFFISGFTDIETVGNQSFKNTIKYLLEYGYRIQVFTFMPEDYPNLHDPKKIFNSNVEFHRLPDILSFILYSGKRAKDLIGKKKGIMSRPGTKTHEIAGTYLREYNPVGRMFYLAFLFLFYLPIELLRVLVYSLQYKPDLVYGVNCQGAVVASIAGRLLKKPVITRFHGVSVSEHDLASWKNRLFVLDEIAGLTAKTDAVIVTNDGSKGDVILRTLNVEDKKIHFWMNGLDTNQLISPNHRNQSDFKKELGIEGKKVILMISRLVTWKRVDRGIHCIYRLVKEHKMTEVILLIIGDGPERQRLEELSEKFKIKDSVRFLGGMPHKEIGKYYAMADVFLSLYDISNLGNPVLEAMHFGLPIVTINDGSTCSLLEDGNNAFLVKIEKLEVDLPHTVKMLLENEQLRKRMGQNAKKTFKEKVLSWEERIELEDRLIKKILTTRG